ncbi:MAG: energy transducer TonB [Myxococcota bacterium]
MNLSPYRPVPRWQRVLRGSAVGVSVAVHVVLGLLAAANPVAAKKASEWVEIAISEPPKPKPEPEEPKPEPEKPKPKPKAVKFEEIPPPEVTPPPETQPQPSPERVVRRVQGLSASSFANSGAGGFQVKAGNTVATKQSSDTLDPADAGWQARPYTAVSVAPKPKWSPSALEVPEEAKQAKVEGTVHVKLDIDPTGKVMRVAVVSDLGHGTGKACADAWKKSSWKPAEQDGEPVAVLGVPQKCTIQIEE